MTVSFTDLAQLGFVASHRIALDPAGLPRFSALSDTLAASAPGVYLWLAHDVGAEVAEVLYVGKAGRGVARRCDQHQSGFSNSGTGRKNATALSTILAGGTTQVTVMARTSDSASLFGKTVSMYAAEEDALCSLFAPRLNRAVFPVVDGADDEDNIINMSGPGATSYMTQASLTANIDATSQAEHESVPLGDMSRIVSLINARLRVQDIGTVDDVMAQMEAYGLPDRRRLAKLLEVLEAQVLAADDALKLIGGYGAQPRGCSGVTTLGFGRLVGQNFAPNSWVARVYMATSPRVAFPLGILNPSALDAVERNETLFSPTDVDTFLQYPRHYIIST